MGYSQTYTVIAGLAELIPAILLFFRPTYLLGAPLLAPVLFNVAALNYLYAVPVKQYSTLLVLMALGLIAPHTLSLLRFLRGHPALVTLPKVELPPKWRPYWIGAKCLLLAVMIIGDASSTWKLHQERLQIRASSTVGGVYSTNTPTSPFRKLAITPQTNNRAMIRVEYANTTSQRFLATFDTQKSTMDVGSSHYQYQLTGNTLSLTDSTGSYLFRRVPQNYMTLLSTPFAWVQEFPFNR
jgi:hypothetical protein